METLDFSAEHLRLPAAEFWLPNMYIWSTVTSRLPGWCLAWWVVFSHVHMSGSRWGCHMLEGVNAPTSHLTRHQSVATVSDTAEKGLSLRAYCQNPLYSSHGWYKPLTAFHNTYSTLRTLLCDGPACGLEIETEATIGAHPQ